MNRFVRRILATALPAAAAVAITVVAAPASSAATPGYHCNGGASPAAGQVCADLSWVHQRHGDDQTYDVKGRGGVLANSGHKLCITGVALYEGSTRRSADLNINVCSTGAHRNVWAPYYLFTCTTANIEVSVHVSYTVDGSGQRVLYSNRVTLQC